MGMQTTANIGGHACAIDARNAVAAAFASMAGNAAEPVQGMWWQYHVPVRAAAQ